MTFDPFGDFDERGYLRNKAGLHDQNAIKEFEHRAFLDKLESRSLRRPSSFHTKTSSKLTTSCSRKSNPGQDRTARAQRRTLPSRRARRFFSRIQPTLSALWSMACSSVTIPRS